MALTSQTTLDLIGQTQSIIFMNPSQVDQISFASNQITWQASSSFNLAKTDLLLYLKFVNTFNNLLITNFPSVASGYASAWPSLCQFDITESFAGVEHIYYTQTSQGSQVIQINYLPSVVSASFATRASPITLTMQEFFMQCNMLNQYAIQVGLN